MKSADLWSAVAGFARTVFTPQHERLNVPKGFPVQTFVYLCPHNYPTKDMTAQCRYLSATYQGGDTWRVNDLEWAPHEMGTDVLTNGDPTYLTSRQLVSTFDARLAEHLSQAMTDYGGEKHFANARAAIIDQFVPSMVMLEHRAA
jgi:hypothetical protein